MNNEDYRDIINLPHHVSVKHPPMSMEARAAQFAPFAALTGYEEEIKDAETTWLEEDFGVVFEEMEDISSTDSD